MPNAVQFDSYGGVDVLEVRGEEVLGDMCTRAGSRDEQHVGSACRWNPPDGTEYGASDASVAHGRATCLPRVRLTGIDAGCPDLDQNLTGSRNRAGHAHTGIQLCCNQRRIRGSYRGLW